MIQSQIDITSDVAKMVEEAIGKAIDQEITMAINRIEERRAEIILSAMTTIQRITEVAMIGERIIFTVKPIEK